MLDYVIVKIPKWPFNKFKTASRDLGTQMKATGEVMAIAPSLEQALMKAIRSLEENLDSLQMDKLTEYSTEKILEQLKSVDNERIWCIAESLRRGITIDEIHNITKIDKFFISKFDRLVRMEEELVNNELTTDLLLKAKKMGYTDKVIAALAGLKEEDIKNQRLQNNIVANYKLVDTCSAEFEAKTPYYYSSYDEENESIDSGNSKKIVVLGSGPIRIGQGIEFDYCSVHSVLALRKLGYETIIVNNNPETVSTDFDIADKLYFEPLTPEDVENIINVEKPMGAIVQFGGQTAIKLTKALSDMGVKILGTDQVDMDRAEDRELFDEALENCKILRPKGGTVYTAEEAKEIANNLKYPVLVRPSYVLGGQGMAIAYDDNDVDRLISDINEVTQEHPILVDKYMMGKEMEVDAISDGEDVLIPGVMELLERAGIHSGDSISVYPTSVVEQKYIDTIIDYTKRIAKELHIIGLFNIQFIICEGEVYIIEVNPRASRTIPYISKVTGLPVIDVATRVILGEKLKDMDYGTGIYKKSKYVAVKMPIFSFQKLKNADTSLGPEMKSTGEVLGVSKHFSEAILKAFIASGINVVERGKILVTVNDKDKPEILPIIKKLVKQGYSIYATSGTANYLKEHGVENVESVPKIWEGTDSIPDLIHSGKLSFIINTPTKGKESNRDGFKIRRLAAESKVPCFTAIDTVIGFYDAIAKGLKEEDLELVNIAEI